MRADGSAPVLAVPAPYRDLIADAAEPAEAILLQYEPEAALLIAVHLMAMAMRCFPIEAQPRVATFLIDTVDTVMRDNCMGETAGSA